MTSDGELRAALQGAGGGFDPAFRVRVVERICARERRRAAIERVSAWLAGGVAAGLLGLLLTPSASGTPGLETVVMIVSLAGAIYLLGEIATVGPRETAPWLRQVLPRLR